MNHNKRLFSLTSWLQPEVTTLHYHPFPARRQASATRRRTLHVLFSKWVFRVFFLFLELLFFVTVSQSSYFILCTQNKVRQICYSNFTSVKCHPSLHFIPFADRSLASAHLFLNAENLLGSDYIHEQ